VLRPLKSRISGTCPFSQHRPLPANPLKALGFTPDLQPEYSLQRPRQDFLFLSGEAMSIRTVAIVALALSAAGCMPKRDQDQHTVLRSLTDSNYKGNKYYLGWGEYLSGFMGNETKYDVKHTHDIFTDNVGGKYQSTTLVDREFSGRDVTASMNSLRSKITKDDMYVQYSSGHGFPAGLGIDVSYKQIVDHSLAMNAKEVVVFLMACHSGGLVNQFNARKSEWQDWSKQGRTLFVMSSSTEDEKSKTGPRQDAAEAGGPEGSAGSAYGHALWKALSGEADGYLDGVKDGFISLGEIAAYTTWKTQQVGGHTPQVTGTYNPYLLMNQVPKQSWVASLPGGTQEMSVAEVKESVQASDYKVNKYRQKYLEDHK
jgi:hypothetical protein